MGVFFFDKRSLRERTSMRNTIAKSLLLSFLATTCAAQALPTKWEELTAPDFVKALEQAKGTCIIPFGILEKHGPAGPLGTDLINVRYGTLMAVKQEYAIVFPEYYFGQIFEARQQPGTIAYSSHVQLELLTETTSEMARNGCRKILIINGHGGNTNLLQYFAQSQLDSPKDYVIYVWLGSNQPTGQAAAQAAAPSRPGADGHAGENEISNVLASRPDLAHPERSSSQSGADAHKLNLPNGLYTGIWWYAKFPNHYQGDSSGATAARGEALTKIRVEGIVSAIRAVKADEAAAQLQKEFFDKAKHPLDTKQ
jgi:creatinine amidohydrolase